MSGKVVKFDTEFLDAMKLVSPEDPRVSVVQKCQSVGNS